MDLLRDNELAWGKTWSMSIIDWRGSSLRVAWAGCTAWPTVVFRLVLGAFFGPVRWRLALVALRKEELATLSREGGRARRKRCDLGSC